MPNAELPPQKALFSRKNETFWPKQDLIERRNLSEPEVNNSDGRVMPSMACPTKILLAEDNSRPTPG
jgi:hypothetical protein